MKVDLNKGQKKLYAGIKDAEKALLADNVSRGMPVVVAKMFERIETANQLFLATLRDSGLASGEVRDLYLGKSDGTKVLTEYLVDMFSSVSLIASHFSIPLEDIVKQSWEKGDRVVPNPGGEQEKEGANETRR